MQGEVKKFFSLIFFDFSSLKNFKAVRQQQNQNSPTKAKNIPNMGKLRN